MPWVPIIGNHVRWLSVVRGKTGYLQFAGYIALHVHLFLHFSLICSRGHVIGSVVICCLHVHHFDAAQEFYDGDHAYRWLNQTDFVPLIDAGQQQPSQLGLKRPGQSTQNLARTPRTAYHCTLVVCELPCGGGTVGCRGSVYSYAGSGSHARTLNMAWNGGWSCRHDVDTLRNTLV